MYGLVCIYCIMILGYVENWNIMSNSCNSCGRESERNCIFFDVLLVSLIEKKKFFCVLFEFVCCI